MSIDEMSLPDSSLVTTKIQQVINSDKGLSLADVTLVTSDKVHIPAVRLLLAMSSSYFEKLFSAVFAEGKLAKVSVSLPSSLLQEILEYIHTDDCKRLRVMRKETSGFVTVSCKNVRAVIELADAADYTGVERLVSRCEEAVKCAMQTAPHTACTALPALDQGRRSWAKGLVKKAVKTAVQLVDESLLSSYDACDVPLACGLMHLGVKHAEDVFVSVKTAELEEDKLFQALMLWGSGGTALLQYRKRPSWSDCDIIVDTSNFKVLEDRLEPAQRIASWFSISSFKPGFISHVVEDSGLVDRGVLCAAYKQQTSQLENLVKSKDADLSATNLQLKWVREELRWAKEEVERLKNPPVDSSDSDYSDV